MSARAKPLPWFETPDEIGAERPDRWSAWIARIPVLALPFAVILFAREHEAWQFMWLLAFAIYCGCKWLTWWPVHACGGFQSRLSSIGYLLLWPGMDPRPFMSGATQQTAAPGNDSLGALAKVAFGATLIWIVAPRLPLEAGAWIAMAGILFVLHFGGFHLLASFWRAMGVNVQPVMRAPALATSLAEFWSNRWNTSFSALAHDHIVMPLKRIVGMRAAIFAVFLASGFVHELVISLPARGGYGLPTAYFLFQWIGIAIERSAFGRRAGLQRGIRGWAFMALFTAAPLYWLFHPTFVHRVIVPFLQALGAIDKGGIAMTITLENLLRIGGILQLAVLTAAALVPKVLDWRRSLAPLSEFLRKMFWVYGVFIAMTIIAFATLTLAHAGTLAGGSPLARSVCGVIAIFWGARLLIQLFVFDIRPLNVNFLLRLGYHGLTAVFTYLAAIFGYAALAGIR